MRRRAIPTSPGETARCRDTCWGDVRPMTSSRARMPPRPTAPRIAKTCRSRAGEHGVVRSSISGVVRRRLASTGSCPHRRSCHEIERRSSTSGSADHADVDRTPAWVRVPAVGVDLPWRRRIASCAEPFMPGIHRSTIRRFFSISVSMRAVSASRKSAMALLLATGRQGPERRTVPLERSDDQLPGWSILDLRGADLGTRGAIEAA